MTPPRALERATRLITIRIFDEDADYLKLAYAGVGYNSVLRALAARHVRKLRNRTAENLETEALSKEELENV